MYGGICPVQISYIYVLSQGLLLVGEIYIFTWILKVIKGIGYLFR